MMINRQRLQLCFTLLLISLFISSCGGSNDTTPTNTNNATPAPAASATPTPSPKDRAPAAITSNFGDKVKVVDGHEPWFLTGDFNGDGQEDLAVVVDTNGQKDGFAPDVKVVNVRTTPAPAGKKTLSLAILQGSKDGWNTKPAAKYLLLDAVSGDVSKIEYDKSHEAITGKGDSIMTTGDAGKGIVIWDGQNYKWQSQS